MDGMERSREETPALSIKDKVNFPYLIARQIITYQQAILNTEHSRREIQEAINGLVELIPDSWKDEDWKKDEKEADVEEIFDVGPRVAGSTRMNEATCKSLGIPKWKIVKTKDANKMFHACINLLDRRGIISKVSRTEKVFGEEWDGP